MTDALTIVRNTVTPLGRAPQRCATTGLVAFLFGVAGVPQLPGVVLTELLAEFGLSAAAARQQLARMRADGQLASTRSGRGVNYRRAGRFAATAGRVRGAGTVPVWDGSFPALLYQVPESQRAYRDRLRRQATFVGYGIVQPGVLIAVHDHAGELADVVAQAPAGSHVRHARIGMDTTDAAEVAATAWDLPQVAEVLDGHLAVLRAALIDPAALPADATTLRRMAELVNAASIDLIRDPGLPAVLSPPDWPGAELRAALERVKQRFLPPAAAYVAAKLQAAR